MTRPGSPVALIWLTLAAVVLVVHGCDVPGTGEHPGESEQPATGSTSSACELPTEPVGSPEELAWRIFVAANCRTDSGQLQWETWLSQACLGNPADCTGHQRLRGSVSTTLVVEPEHPSPREAPCSGMTTTKNPNRQLLPFVPANLSDDPVFCEEVVINGAEEAYARANGLLSVAGQVRFLEAGGTVKTPPQSVELKVDWVPASSFTDVTFDCGAPSPTIYLQELSGVCYALAGMHISSKLFPNWLWATFEPQDPRTNPNRCDPRLYNACVDDWGSDPPQSARGDTGITDQLRGLLDAAGAALDPSFANYRLTGVQTGFDDPVATGGLLGSSFVEFNAKVAPHQASCITCHYYASRDSAGNHGQGGPFAGDPATGQPRALPAGFDSLDFSWFLAFGVPK